MSVNIESIKEGAVIVVNRLVGEDLAKYGDTPATFIAKPNSPYTKYPYITIQDFPLNPSSGGWGLKEYVTEGGQHIVRDTKRFLLKVKCFDRKDVNRSHNIINKLEGFLRKFPSVRRAFKESTTATLEIIQQIRDESYTDKEGFVNATALYITIVATDIDSDPIFDGLIEKVIGDEIEILKHKDDPNPLIVDLN